MKTIKIRDKIKQEFLYSLFDIKDKNPYNLISDGESIKSDNDVIITMLERFDIGKTSVLAFKSSKFILWMVLNEDYRSLVSHYGEIERFIVPTLAENIFSNLTKFNPDKGELGKLGAILFEDGYLCLRSPIEFEEEIFKRLNLWARLDMERPQRRDEELKANAYTLRSRFNQALAVGDWEQGRSILDNIKQSHYISYENGKFLEIRLLMEQGKWKDIWNMPDYKDIAKFKQIPVLIRETLLTAFYKSQIAILESKGDFDGILDKFKETGNMLGNLLKYRTGLEGDVFLRIFAYNYTLNKKKPKLEKLLSESKDPDTISIVRELLKRLEDEVKPPEELAGLKLAEKHYLDGNYDDAYQVIQTCDTTPETIRFFIELAAKMDVPEVYKNVSEAYIKLTELQKEELKKEPFIRLAVEHSMKFLNQQKEEKEEKVLPLSWSEWFGALADLKFNREEFESSAKKITIDSEDMPINLAEINNLTETVMEMVGMDMNAEQKVLLKFCIQDFVTYLLNDKNYPNPAAEDLYEVVMEFIREYGNKNEYNLGFLLKLSEALLQLDISHIHNAWSTIENWINFIPNMKYAFFIIEILDLFKEYGLPNTGLSLIWNNWVGTLLGQFDNDNRAETVAWLELGRLIGGDSSLIKELESIMEVAVDIDPIALIPECVITIYSLREGAPEQAAQEIMKRNPKLKVRICKDNYLTDNAKNYAINSDIVIVTTTCMSHALTYGIAPFLKKDPVYPRSSGKTGIIQALEVYWEKMND